MMPVYHRLQSERLQDKLAFFAILVALLIFYPELFLVRSGALIADHLEQHYPWAHLLWTSLRHGEIPFWTPLIQCGFPIAAEGQIGVFYLPNIALNLLLPFHWAYSYTHVVHYLVAGWGAYAYARQMKLIPLAAFMASFVYLFGTSYGGAYYNVTSLKVLAWFPWMLFCFERFICKRKIKLLLGFAFLVSLSVLAGYLQVAIFELLILSVYIILRLFFIADQPSQRLRGKIACLVAMGVAFLLGVLIALPQLCLTFDLAMRSNRAVAAEGYAYVGSLFPGALTTLLFPHVQVLFRGNCFYLGVFSLILLFFSFLRSENPDEKRLSAIWLWTSFISLFLALGQWSPLYVAIVKLTHFYAFRTPSKFLIFVCFGLSMLAGLGFQKAWLLKSEGVSNGLGKKVAKQFLISFAAFAGVIAAFLLFISTQQALARRIGDWFILRFLYQKPGHPRTLAEYQENMAVYLNHTASFFSFHHPWALLGYAMLGVGMIFAIFLAFQKTSVKKWLVFGFVFLAVDLYVFSFFDIKTDFASYQSIERAGRAAVPGTSKAGEGAQGRIFGYRARAESLPIVPNTNMLYGMEDIGVYSPFVFSRYYETIGQLGNVNDSNLLQSASPEFVLDHLNLLNFLDVDVILSTQALRHPDLFLESVDSEKDYRVYKNQGMHARAFFVTQFERVKDWETLKAKLMAPGFDPRKVLFLLEEDMQKINGISLAVAGEARATLRQKIQTNMLEQWEIETDRPGFFVISNSMFPGWRAKIDGREVPLLYANGLFQSVFITTPGRHRVVLRFTPFSNEQWRKLLLNKIL